MYFIIFYFTSKKKPKHLKNLLKFQTTYLSVSLYSTEHKIPNIKLYF